MQIRPVAHLVIMIALCLMVGGLSGFFTRGEVSEWYPTLTKPLLTPPSWVFGVVWPILYCLMGLSAGMIWNKPIGRTAARAALRLFIVQLVLNGFWSPVFFGFHLIDVALIEIVLLWLAVAATTITFFIQLKPAGMLMLPYWAWISFAVYLNAGIWFLNK